MSVFGGADIQRFPESLDSNSTTEELQRYVFASKTGVRRGEGWYQDEFLQQIAGASQKVFLPEGPPREVPLEGEFLSVEHGSVKLFTGKPYFVAVSCEEPIKLRSESWEVMGPNAARVQADYEHLKHYHIMSKSASFENSQTPSYSAGFEEYFDPVWETGDSYREVVGIYVVGSASTSSRYRWAGTFP